MDKKIKSILGSVLVIAIAASMMTVGTHSFFTDTETAKNNVFTAGTIDISLNPANGQDVTTVEGDLELKPCQTGYTTTTVTNDGNNPCEVWKHITNVENRENGKVEPEQEYYDTHDGSENWKLSNWIHYDLFACMGPAKVPQIDGSISADEWDSPIASVSGDSQNIEVYALATPDTLYLGFKTSDVTDNRGGSGLDVLDWNIGLMGADYAPGGCGESGFPWRYALRTKVSPDNSWGNSYSELDPNEAGDPYYGTWEDTWNPNPNDPDTSYYPVPEGIEMETSFATGYRVSEFKIPTSLLFDGTHGWNAKCSYTLLLGGTYSGENDAGDFEMLWWPEGISHCDDSTYAQLESEYELTQTISEDEGFMLTGENGVECKYVYLGVLQPGESMLVKQSYHLDKTVENWGQSDKVVFDMEFVAQQIEGEELPDPPGTVLPEYGR